MDNCYFYLVISDKFNLFDILFMFCIFIAFLSDTMATLPIAQVKRMIQNCFVLFANKQLLAVLPIKHTVLARYMASTVIVLCFVLAVTDRRLAHLHLHFGI